MMPIKSPCSPGAAGALTTGNALAVLCASSAAASTAPGSVTMNVLPTLALDITSDASRCARLTTCSGSPPMKASPFSMIWWSKME